MIIRKALQNDLPVILAMYADLAGLYDGVKEISETQAAQAWQRISADDRQHLLVAEEAGQVVGTLNLTIIPNLGHGGQPWAAIDNVVVDSASRGKGIGVKLLETAGDIAREHRCYKLILSSNLIRTSAHDFYRRLGWKETHIGFSLEL